MALEALELVDSGGLPLFCQKLSGRLHPIFLRHFSLEACYRLASEGEFRYEAANVLHATEKTPNFFLGSWR